MFNFPYFGYPYSYPYYKYNNQYSSNSKNIPNQEIKDEQKKDSITNSKQISNTINSRTYTSSDQAIYDIFGIKLYLDDLIILGLLFFLYQQDVHDEMLYIILLLLLFS